MLPSDSRSLRPDRRARRRTHLAAVERLESRALMATNPLGFSLPDLTITGSAANRAAWGGQLGIIATVINQGASTITNPIAQAPGDLSTADAPASTVRVVITPGPTMARAVTIGEFQAPPVIQNSLEQIQEAFTLPSRPRGFAGPGGRFYVHLIVNPTGSVLEASTTNNTSAAFPVRVAGRALPQLSVTELDVPSSLAPGDTIAPTISITNNGTAAAGPFEVALVASTTPTFNLGSSIVALYDVTQGLPAASAVAPGTLIAAFSQTNPISNSLTFAGPLVTLPTSPAKYYLGVVIDPYGKLPQLHGRSAKLSQVRIVQGTAGLPPAGVISTSNNQPFPYPPSGVFIGVNPTATTSSSGTGTTNPSTIF